MRILATLLLILILSISISYGQIKNDSSLIPQEGGRNVFLFLNGTNICFYNFVAGPNSVFSYHPGLAVNLGSKISLSSKMSLLFSIGYLQKNFDYIINISTHQSNKLDIQNSVKAIIGVIGLEHKLKISKNVSFNIGSEIALKYDINFKSIRNYIVIYQMDQLYWHSGESEVTTNGNIGIGLNLNSGFTFMFSHNIGINICLQYSLYKYFKNPISHVKVNDTDNVTGKVTYTENTFNPEYYIGGETLIDHNQFIKYDKNDVIHTGGSNFFGNSDFVILIGIIYKIK